MAKYLILIYGDEQIWEAMSEQERKDNEAAHGKFAAKYDLAVKLGSDPDGAVIERYGSWVEKTLYGRQYMGIDRSTFLIRDGKVQRIWRKVKVPGHAQQVLDAAKSF